MAMLHVISGCENNIQLSFLCILLYTMLNSYEKEIKQFHFHEIRKKH